MYNILSKMVTIASNAYQSALFTKYKRYLSRLEHFNQKHNKLFIWPASGKRI